MFLSGIEAFGHDRNGDVSWNNANVICIMLSLVRPKNYYKDASFMKHSYQQISIKNENITPPFFLSLIAIMSQCHCEEAKRPKQSDNTLKTKRLPRSLWSLAMTKLALKHSLILAFTSISIMFGSVSHLQAQNPMSAQGLPQGMPSSQGQLPQLFQLQQGGQQQAPEMKEQPQERLEQEVKPTVPAAKPAIEKASEFEKYISGKSSLEVSTDIKQFGYDLFRQPPATFAPVDNVPVGPDYVLGPGDEIKITVWGKVEGQWSVFVDRDGNINLPKVGILGVAGLTFMELKGLLQKEFSRYFTGFEMNVSMGALRTIRVYIVGNAERPGAYTVSSFSTLVNALFEAGGPSKTGTMRDIQLKRNGKTIVHFDMYDLLLSGDKTKDMRLMPEDVIFIPPVGVLAGIAGNVKSPAIYELKDEMKLLDLINMAGGLTGIAFKERVQVQRIEAHQFKTIFESDLIEIEKRADKNFTIKDSDLVRIFSVIDTKNTMSVSGTVAVPGEYGVVSGVTRVRDIISLVGGLLYYASNEAELTRVKVTQTGPEMERFVLDLSKVRDGDPKHNIPLEVNDYLFVRAVPEWRLYKTVEMSGEVRYPGTYTIVKGERLSSLLERAGGFTDRAYLPGVVFTRKSVQELQQKNLNDAIDRLEQQLLSQSSIAMQTALTPEEAQQHKIVSDQQNALLAKMRAAKAQGRMVIRFDKLERFKGSIYDIELEDGDSLNIPAMPGSIQVLGSVYNPTAFLYDPKATISRYLEKAGGTTKYAEDDDTFVLKVDGSAISRRQGGVFFMSSRLEPGDTIVIPEQVERIAWLREVKDITQIIFQLAVTAGVVIALF